jgi:hypothetical protein
MGSGMPEPEIYVSTDVESNGPIPGMYSMLSFASAAYLPDKTLVGTYAANLELLPGASEHPGTMAFWKNEAAAWEASRQDLQLPEKAMMEYVLWLKSLPGKPVFVAYPVGYDFTLVYWYLMRFVGESPFGHNGIDIRSYAMAMLKKGYKESGKRNMPKKWFDDIPHNHTALDDALEQGALFCNMLMQNTK